MSETYELLKAIEFAFQYQINCELTHEQCKWILDWYEKWHKDQSFIIKQDKEITELEARIIELEAELNFLRLSNLDNLTRLEGEG